MNACHARSLFSESKAEGHKARQTVSTSRASRATDTSSCSGLRCWLELPPLVVVGEGFSCAL